MTVSQLLNEAFSLLGNDKIIDVELALIHALGVDRVYLIVNKDLEIDENSEKVFREYLKRLAQGMPISYITNAREFYGIDFYVDSRVLVPRQETEELVDRAITYFKTNIRGKKEYKILDIGTGSGNIGISIVKTLDEMPIKADLIDISDDAIEVARMNVSQHNLEHKIDVYQSDLLLNVEKNQHFDVVLANLPYIGTEKHNFVEGNVEKHEPRIALFGGKTGLELYEKLFSQLRERNISFEFMLGEFGFSQGDDLKKLLDKNFFKKYVIVKDMAELDRIFLINGN